jgi:rhamnogalacturonyl hydrolase YesR
VSAQLTEAKSAIRWMHGYDEPGTEAFPICPEGKRYAWRGVSWQQFSIVREACAEQIPAPETKP